MFPVSNRNTEQCHWILYIRISLVTKILLKLTIMPFWTKFAQKEYFLCKTENVNTTLAFRIFQLFLVLNFNWGWQCWYFGPNFPKKSVSPLKLKKWTPPLNFAYSNNSCCYASAENDLCAFLDQISLKRVFPVKTPPLNSASSS